MKNKNLNKILITTISFIFLAPFTTIYAQDGINIMEELNTEKVDKINDAIQKIGETGGGVWDEYNKQASGMTTSMQIASGIMNRDTITNYLVFVVQFLSHLGLAVGAIFIMYAGYKYMVSVFIGGKGAPKSTIINAITGVIIVIFSYAIMRILTSFIGLT